MQNHGNAYQCNVASPPVNPDAMPVSGRYLAHCRLSLVERSFLGADLHTGVRQLVLPTVLQAAWLVRVNPSTATGRSSGRTIGR